MNNEPNFDDDEFNDTESNDEESNNIEISDVESIYSENNERYDGDDEESIDVESEANNNNIDSSNESSACSYYTVHESAAIKPNMRRYLPDRWKIRQRLLGNDVPSDGDSQALVNDDSIDEDNPFGFLEIEIESFKSIRITSDKESLSDKSLSSKSHDTHHELNIKEREEERLQDVEAHEPVNNQSLEMLAQTATNITYERTYLAARNIDIETLNAEEEVNTNDIIDIPYCAITMLHYY